METERQLQVQEKSPIDIIRDKFHEVSNLYSNTKNKALGHQIGVLIVSLQTELFKSETSLEDVSIELAVLSKDSQNRAHSIEDKLSETLFRVLYDGYTALSNRPTVEVDHFEVNDILANPKVGGMSN